MARNDSFFTRLSRIFRSGPSITRKVKGYDYKNYYDNELIRGNYGYRAPMPFGRENSPFSALGNYGILDRMSRYCLSGDMLVATNSKTGFISMKELSEIFIDGKPENEKYYTFSYEKETDSIVLREILNAFYTKEEEIIEVHYDNGAILKCTKDHKVMLRDGSYKEAQDLKKNDAVMPFYRKELKKYKNGNDYRVIYSPSDGWRGEHKIVGDYILGRKILPEDNFHVHHKNFCGIDNLISNLEVLSAENHMELHAEDGKRSSERKSQYWDELLNNHSSKAMEQMKNIREPKEKFEIIYPNCSKPEFLNPNVDKMFLLENIINNWEPGITFENLCKKCEVHCGKLRSRLQWAGYEDYCDFVRKNFDPKYKINRPRPKFLGQLPSLQEIYSLYRKGMTQRKIADHFGFRTNYRILSVLRKNGYDTWYKFINSYENNKVSKIVFTGKIEKVFDLTVDGTHNFAVISPETMQPCGIVHNSEFAEMEYMPEVATALSIWADETVSGDDKNRSFHIFSRNPEVRKALEELFYDILNVEYNMRSWARNLVKYGDVFLYNEVIPDIGVVNVQPIPVNELEREEGFDHDDPYSVRFKWLTRSNRYLDNWQISHFRILGNDILLPYGTSLLEPARRVFRQLTLMEDAMLVYRIVRSPDRRVFYVDVGNIAPNDVPSYMEAVKATMNSNNVMERQTGRQDQRYNPTSVLEDYYIPVRGGQTATKIETLAGGQNATATEDVKYLQSKLFAALQVPKPYLTFDENLCVVENTRINLLDGRILTIEELTNEFQNGNKNIYVYSCTPEGKIVPGKIVNAWKTKEVNETLKITLDNGEFVECTPNHPFMLRNGTYIRADELKPEMSLMPLYRKLSNKESGDKLDGYEMVYDNQNNDWKYTHKVVNEWTAEHNGGHKIGKARVVHHADFKKLNNHPDNLVEMTWYGHRKYHSEHLEETIMRPDVIEKRKIKVLEWLKSDEHREISSTQMIYETTTPGRPLYEWIHSEEMKQMASEQMTKNWEDPEYRALKTKQNKEIWERPEVREKNSGENHWIRRRNSEYTFEWLVKFCKENPEICYKHFKYSGKHGMPIHIDTVQRLFKENNVKNWREFRKNYLNGNHKISKIEVVQYKQPIAVYDITIENPEETSNFSLNCGIFVHNSSKAGLSQQDIRFSRTISVLQKVIIAEFNKLAMIHLYAKGFDEEDLADFELRLSNPSTVAMQQKLEALSTKFDIVGKAKDVGVVDEEWIQKKILELTEDEIIRIETGRRRDKVRNVELEAIAVKENLPQKDTTVDPFDPSNYTMTGGGVEKNPALPDEVLSNDVNVPSLENGEEYNDQNKVVDTGTGSSPIKATPFITAQRRKEKRRVGISGRDALSMPDFKTMLSPKNRSLKDITDKDSLNLRNPLTEDSSDGEISFKTIPTIPAELKSIFKKLDKYLESKRGINSSLLLTENVQDSEIIDLPSVELLEEENNKPIEEADLLADFVTKGNNIVEDNGADKNKEKENISDIDLTKIG